MERRRPLGGNPESLIHRLVDDTAPDVDVDEEDFVHRMFAEFHHNSRTDGPADQERERQLRQSEEPLNLIELFTQEGSTSGSARLLALQDLCTQTGAMPTYDPIDMAAALQKAGERELLTSFISDSQRSLTDIVEGDRSTGSLAEVDVMSTSSHEDMQNGHGQLLPFRSISNGCRRGKRCFEATSPASEDSMCFAIVATANNFERLSKAEKTAVRDQCVCWIVSGILFEFNDKRNEVKSRLKSAWSTWALHVKIGWCAHVAEPERHSIPVVIQAERQNLVQTYGLNSKGGMDDPSQPNSGSSSVVDDENNFKLYGVMLTWNGRWGTHHEGIQNLIKLKMPWRAEQKTIREHPLYQWLWGHFVDWAKTTATYFKWPKYSMKMELTIDRVKPCNVVHFHMCVTDSERRHTWTSSEQDRWRYGGVPVHVSPCGAKGIRIEKSLNTIHYYCQAPKIGSLFMATNYPKFTAFAVESSAIYSLWRLYKMTDQSTIRELVRSRCRGFVSLQRDIRNNSAARRQEVEEAEKNWIQQRLPYCSSKVFPEIVKWMQLFTNPSNDRTRFPFLVLNGESQMGKTRFAARLFGESKTLILSCQNIGLPNLRSFRRDQHRCIVFDEASHTMVFNNKQVFQAGIDTVMLGQSNCNEHAYSVWLYGVPLVVSTNDWLLGASVEQQDWLSRNSVLVNVKEKMWVESAMLYLMDRVENIDSDEHEVQGLEGGVDDVD